MNTTRQPIKTASVSSFKMLRAMVGIGILCALLIVLTFEGTLERIKANKAEALEKAIFEVIPGITRTTTFQLDQNNTFSLINVAEKTQQIVYAGYDAQDNLKGVAIEASGQGYADIIRILYGYDPENQKVIGFYVLESKETPGLGDKIEKDPRFLANFEALDVSLADDQVTLQNAVVSVKQGAKKNPWEIDGITGATISSRAIGNIIRTSTAEWVPRIEQNKKAFQIQNRNQ